MEDVLNLENEVPVTHPAAAPKDGGDKGGKDANTERIARLERELDESRGDARFWADRAKSGGSAKADEKADDDTTDGSEFVNAKAGADGIDDDTPEKMVNELAAQGTGALKKRGFITAKDAEKLAADVAVKVANTLIGRARGQMTTEQKLSTEFPELADKSSALYKATAKNYQEACALDPNAKTSPVALYLAAKAAKASLAPASQGRNDDADETEEERRDRARSQDSRPRGRGVVDDRSDSLSDSDRDTIRAFGLTEEEFLASRKEAMSNRPGRR